jgi:Kef-type K+ transport system membrane component KefB
MEQKKKKITAETVKKYVFVYSFLIVQIICFFVFVLVCGIVFTRVFRYIAVDHWHSRRVAIWALAFCLLMSYFAEEWFGVADITGAFFAGLILCNVSRTRKFVAKKVAVTSYMVFTPVFFASVGMKTDLSTVNGEIMLFALVLLAVGIVATSVLSAILVGITLFFFALMLTSTACLVRCLVNCRS